MVWVFFTFVVCMFLLGILTMYFNLYVWASPENLKQSQAPKKFAKPKHTFTILLPALHEEDVIGHTIAQIAKQNYPKSKYEVIFIGRPDDIGTFNVASRALKENNVTNGQAIQVSLDHSPLNKPYQLNCGLKETKGDFLVIFDSEDEVHPDILNVANTVIVERKVDVLQMGVQLMNYTSRWFSVHNVLEYYFWFKSRMHAHIKLGAVPLGGNTVFFNTKMVRELDGWNENCLAEDAEIGVRLSAAGAKIDCVYEAEYVTKEETPLTIEQFVKQRTRWCQGFFQVIKLGHWRRLPTRMPKVMALFLMGFPALQALTLFLTPIVFAYGLTFQMPLIIAIFSFMPLFFVLMFMLMQVAALWQFTHEQHLKFSYRTLLVYFVTFGPYQFLLALGAARAVWRELKSQNNWEKTAHTGQHRTQTDAKA